MASKTSKCGFCYAKKLKSLVSFNNKMPPGSELKISKTRQWEFFNIGCVTHYYKPVLLNANNLQIMHTIYEIATNNSSYGYWFFPQWLRENVYCIGKERVLKYMQFMKIYAIYSSKKRFISLGNPKHKIYEYSLYTATICQDRILKIHIPTSCV